MLILIGKMYRCSNTRWRCFRAMMITLIIEQDRGPVYQTASSTDDNYGLGAITFFYATTTNTFISTGGATLTGNVDLGGKPINSDDGIDQVRREVSAVGAGIYSYRWYIYNVIIYTYNYDCNRDCRE